jgi:hypothetical protein
VVNQTSETRNNLKAEVEFFNPDGTRQYFTEVSGFNIAPNTSRESMTVPGVPKLASTHLVRATLMIATREVLAESVYWESTTDDDLGSACPKWANRSALKTMPRSDLDVSAQVSDSNGEKQVTITLTNPANHVAFFVHAEVTQGATATRFCRSPTTTTM